MYTYPTYAYDLNNDIINSAYYFKTNLVTL